MKKTMKQKCLEMWEWLAEHPDKNKDDYLHYLVTQGQGLEYADCWACQYNNEKEIENKNPISVSLCTYCPITFPPTTKTDLFCLGQDSPFKFWTIARRQSYPLSYRATEQAAKAMVRLIKNTWKDEE